MKNLTVKQKKVARIIQKDMAVTRFPFRETGILCGLQENDVLTITKQLKEKGIIRRFGAVLKHQKAGYKKNALVVWSVPAKRTNKTGKIFSSFSFISHCYERKPAFNGKYNIFTMLHTNYKNYSLFISKMADASGISDFMILESVKEYKKTSPEYFNE